MKKSKFLTLEAKDAMRAFSLAILSSVLTAMVTVLDAGSMDFDWKKIGTVAAATAGSYILKNWLTNSDDQVLKKEIR